MPLASLQSITPAGLAPAYATPNATEQIVPNDRQFLHVKNASGSSMNVTITDPGTTPAGNVATNPVIAVPAAGERMIFLNMNLMNTVTGTIQVAFSSTTSVTAAVLRA